MARLLGVPGEDEEMFPEWDEYLRLEQAGGSAPDLIDVSGEADGAEDAGETLEEAKSKVAAVDEEDADPEDEEAASPQGGDTETVM